MTGPTLPRPGSDFKLPPEGTWPGVCTRIIDLGTQPQRYKGQESDPKHIVLLTWELWDDETMLDGDNGEKYPMTIHRRFTWSMSPKANLRKALESWRGKPFQDTDFDTFDIRNLLGVGCLLQVIHRENEGNTYANVGAVVKLPKGMNAPKPKNSLECLWLSPDVFDQEMFNGLSEKMQETIKGSPEYQELIGDNAGMDNQDACATSDVDDDTPF